MKRLKHYSKEKKEKNLKRSWLRNLINLFLEKVLKPEEQMVNKKLKHIKFTYFPVTKIGPVLQLFNNIIIYINVYMY